MKRLVALMLVVALFLGACAEKTDYIHNLDESTVSGSNNTVTNESSIDDNDKTESNDMEETSDDYPTEKTPEANITIPIVDPEDESIDKENIETPEIKFVHDHPRSVFALENTRYSQTDSKDPERSVKDMELQWSGDFMPGMIPNTWTYEYNIVETIEQNGPYLSCLLQQSHWNLGRDFRLGRLNLSTHEWDTTRKGGSEGRYGFIVDNKFNHRQIDTYRPEFNFYKHNSLLYGVSRQFVKCYDASLNLLWETVIPLKETSRPVEPTGEYRVILDSRNYFKIIGDYAFFSFPNISKIDYISTLYECTLLLEFEYGICCINNKSGEIIWNKELNDPEYTPDNFSITDIYIEEETDEVCIQGIHDSTIRNMEKGLDLDVLERDNLNKPKVYFYNVVKDKSDYSYNGMRFIYIGSGVEIFPESMIYYSPYNINKNEYQREFVPGIYITQIGNIIYSHSYGSILAYDLATNSFMWRYDYVDKPKFDNDNILVHKESIIIVSNNHIESVSTTNGQKLWEYKFERDDEFELEFHKYGSDLLFCNGTKLEAVGLDDGSLTKRWNLSNRYNYTNYFHTIDGDKVIKTGFRKTPKIIGFEDGFLLIDGDTKMRCFTKEKRDIVFDPCYIHFQIEKYECSSGFPIPGEIVFKEKTTFNIINRSTETKSFKLSEESAEYKLSEYEFEIKPNSTKTITISYTGATRTIISDKFGYLFREPIKVEYDGKEEILEVIIEGPPIFCGGE